MIFYYSFKNKTECFAKALGEHLNQPVVKLECEMNFFSAMKSCITRKSVQIKNMPDSVPEEIYICSPVWGGNLAAPAKYFLENMNLNGTTVNILLTASVPVEKYKQNALNFLNKIPCQQGRAYIFATSGKIEPEKDVIIEQLGEMLNNG